MFKHILSASDDDMMNSYGSQFNVSGWYSIDLGGPCADVLDFALKDFINSEYFESNLLYFPATLREIYMTKDVENMFDAFGRCIYWFIFYSKVAV